MHAPFVQTELNTICLAGIHERVPCTIVENEELPVEQQRRVSLAALFQFPDAVPMLDLRAWRYCALGARIRQAMSS